MSARLRDLLIAASVVAGGGREASAQITPAERQVVLDAHNRLRCAVDPPALAMPALTWDPRLERVAQDWANTCPTIHNEGRSQRYHALGGSGVVGENLAWGYASWAEILLPRWGGERAGYDYANNSCHHPTGMVSACGHYTQMAWATTRRVGCAQSNTPCPSRGGSGKYYVCDYAPAGNLVGRRPYVAGKGTNDACAATPTSGAP